VRGSHRRWLRAIKWMTRLSWRFPPRLRRKPPRPPDATATGATPASAASAAAACTRRTIPNSPMRRGDHRTNPAQREDRGPARANPRAECRGDGGDFLLQTQDLPHQLSHDELLRQGHPIRLGEEQIATGEESTPRRQGTAVRLIVGIDLEHLRVELVDQPSAVDQ